MALGGSNLHAEYRWPGCRATIRDGLSDRNKPEYQECQKIIDSIYNPRGRAQWRRQEFMQRVIMLTEGVLLRHWNMLTRIANTLKERRELSSEKIYEVIVNRTVPV
jgi:hypothetical protein